MIKGISWLSNRKIMPDYLGGVSVITRCFKVEENQNTVRGRCDQGKKRCKIAGFEDGEESLGPRNVGHF